MWLCREVPESFSSRKYFSSRLNKKTNWFLDAFKDEVDGNRHENTRVCAQHVNNGCSLKVCFPEPNSLKPAASQLRDSGHNQYVSSVHLVCHLILLYFSNNIQCILHVQQTNNFTVWSTIGKLSEKRQNLYHTCYCKNSNLSLRTKPVQYLFYVSVVCSLLTLSSLCVKYFKMWICGVPVGTDHVRAWVSAKSHWHLQTINTPASISYKFHLYSKFPWTMFFDEKNPPYGKKKLY